MRKPYVRTAIVGVGVLLFAAACGGGDDSTDSGNGSASGGGGGGEVYKIGVFGPAQIPQGADIRDGAQLAADEINEEGLAGDREIEIVFCDSENGAKPEKAVQCAQKFAQEDRVDAIVGGFSSGETLAMLDTVVDAQVPFLATGAAAPDVTKGVDSEGERKYIFRVGPINSQFLAADMCVTMITKLAPATKWTKFGILYEDVEFARPLVDFLAGPDRKSGCLTNPSAASGGAIPLETGVQLVGVEKHLPDATDFSSQFRALESKGAQFVIEVNSRQEGVALVKQWGTLKPKFGLGGINVASQSNEFFQATGGAAAYELNGPTGITRTNVSEKTIAFFDAFKGKFNRDPIYNGASTYDAIYVLAEAIEAAGSVEADDVVAELAKTDYIGAQGKITFGPNHDVVYGAGDPEKGVNPLYFQYQPDGTRKVAFPEAFAEGYKYTVPPWLK